jgi:hypothetical protein
MTVKHPSSVRDFAIEVSTDGIGSTIQIFYAGRPSGGMSGFGGTPKRALEDMAELLRKLAADVDAIPSNAK